MIIFNSFIDCFFGARLKVVVVGFLDTGIATDDWLLFERIDFLPLNIILIGRHFSVGKHISLNPQHRVSTSSSKKSSV